MSRSQYPPNFSGKKNGKDQNSVSCTKKISYFWFPQGMIIFPGGVQQKRNFRRGGGVRFGSQFLENPEGRGDHRKNPFRGGGMDIFWNYTLSMPIDQFQSVSLLIFETMQLHTNNPVNEFKSQTFVRAASA